MICGILTGFPSGNGVLNAEAAETVSDGDAATRLQPPENVRWRIGSCYWSPYGYVMLFDKIGDDENIQYEREIYKNGELRSSGKFTEFEDLVNPQHWTPDGYFAFGWASVGELRPSPYGRMSEGTYKFRMRVVNVETGECSEWSEFSPEVVFR